MPRIELQLPEEMVRRIKLEAASENMTLSAWAFKIFEGAFQAQKPAVIKELPSDPQVAFLQQLAEHYHVSVAADKAGVPLVTAMEWLEVESFRDQAGTCQDMFLESVEAQLVAIGRGTAKGNWGALIAFLNAHHPQHGLKGELMSRVLGDTIEQFYSTIVNQVGEDLANSIKTQLKEVAEKKLIQFKR